MMDGSLEEDMKTSASYQYNVRVTPELDAMAHPGGVSLEAELDCLGSLETGQAAAIQPSTSSTSRWPVRRARTWDQDMPVASTAHSATMIR